MSPLFSVQPLPAAVTEWLAALAEDPDSVEIAKREDDGHRQLFDLAYIDKDPPADRAGRIYRDNAGRHFYAYPSMHEADDEAYKATDYLRDYVHRVDEMKEDVNKVSVIDRLENDVRLWKVLAGLAFAANFLGHRW